MHDTEMQLDCLVATATGESRQAIERLGFSIADQLAPRHDPEGGRTAKYLDWDRVARRRYRRRGLY